MKIEGALASYTLGMAYVLLVCGFVPPSRKYTHMAAGVLFVLFNTSPAHFLAYAALVSLNLIVLKVRAGPTYLLLFLNTGALIFAKYFSKHLGIDIASKNNITIQLMLLIPKMFYLSKQSAVLEDSLRYIFFPPSILAGPVIPYSQYLHGAAGTGSGNGGRAASVEDKGTQVLAQAKLAETALFAVLMLTVKRSVPFEELTARRSLPVQILLLYVYGLGFRSQYYLIWSFASACYSLCGYNVLNISFVSVELAQSLKALSKCWNAYIAAFLKECVFMPLKARGVFLASICTFAASSLLHGGHPCYFMLFIALGVAMPALRYSKMLADALLWPWAAGCLNVLVISLIVTYFSVPFYFLDLKRTTEVWRSVSWYGNWMLAVLYLVFFLGRLAEGTARRPGPRGDPPRHVPRPGL